MTGKMALEGETMGMMPNQAQAIACAQDFDPDTFKDEDLTVWRFDRCGEFRAGSWEREHGFTHWCVGYATNARDWRWDFIWSETRGRWECGAN